MKYTLYLDINEFNIYIYVHNTYIYKKLKYMLYFEFGWI